MYATQTQQSVGGLFFHEEANFGKSIKEMRDIADGIRASRLPVQISLYDAKKLIALTTKAVNAFQSGASKVINDGGSAFVRPAMRAVAKEVQNDYNSKIVQRLGGIVNAAAGQGKNTVSSYEFNYRALPLMLGNIANAYETLAEIDDMKPWFLKMVPSYTIGVFVSIGNKVINIATFTASALKNAISAASKTAEIVITVLKWGSIAGGLYLLYGVLKPKKEGQ